MLFCMCLSACLVCCQLARDRRRERPGAKLATVDPAAPRARRASFTQEPREEAALELVPRGEPEVDPVVHDVDATLGSAML